MADDAFDTDPRLERMLADARREEEERQQRARQRNANRNNFLENYQWAKYVVYLWAFRLSFTLLAGVIPMGIGLYHGFFDTSQDVVYTAELPVYTWRHLLKDDFMLFTNQSFRTQPALIQHVPVLSEESLHTLLEVLASKVPSIPVKVQHNSSQFAYFDADRLWSERFAGQRGYQTISHTELPRHVACIHPFLQSLLSSSSSSSMNEEGDDDNGGSPAAPPLCTELPDDGALSSAVVETTTNHPRDYVYLAYPHMSKWLESFAPSVALLSETAKLPPVQTNLWLSSPDVSAHMHYDLQDNVLLQLAGYKTVTIVSPEAMPVVRSYTSLHPLWRQSSLSMEALTPRALHEAWQPTALAASTPTADHDQASLPTESATAAMRSVSTRVSSLYNVSTAMIWQVTLAPGDLLYLPAGFFHSVVSSSSPSSFSSPSPPLASTDENTAPLATTTTLAARETLSINTWYPSRVNELFHRLQRIALPFHVSDRTAVKVAKLMAIMTVVCQLWEAHNRDCLLDELSFRWPAASQTTTAGTDAAPPHPPSTAEPATCPAAAATAAEPSEFCTESALQVAEYNVGTTRTANEIAAVTARSKLSMPLQVLAVVDFFEEALVAVFAAAASTTATTTTTPLLTPCLYASLLQTCRTQRPRRPRVAP